MNPFLIMSQHKGQLTPNETVIYEAIMANPEQVTYNSIQKLAEVIGVSQPAITRFVKTLGYSRYQEFRADITAYIAREQGSSDSSRLSYFERLDRLLKEAEAQLTESYMNDLADYILHHERIIASGIGKSFQPAQLMQNLMFKNDMHIQPVKLDILSDAVDGLNEKDLVIIFSVSAQPEIMEKVSNTSAEILLVTTNSAHRYQEKVNRTVLLPFLPPNAETCSVSPVLFDIFVELLERCLSRRQNPEESSR